MIKVANCTGSFGESYKALQKDAAVLYQEFSLSENSSYLMSDAVDAALISTTDFALHGGCVGLNIGNFFENGKFFLYSKKPVQNLQTIYLQDSVESIWMLLKLLFSVHWNITPRLLRIIRPIKFENLKDDEGILSTSPLKDVPCCEDLVSAWYEWTKVPFVATVWAVKQGKFSPEKQKEITETIKKNLKRSDTAGRFDSPAIAGLNKFFELCTANDLLPKTTYSIRSSSRPQNIEKQALSEILQGVLSGKRLSVNAATRIVKEAKLQDLLLAADILRSRLFTENTSRLIYPLKFKGIKDFRSSIAALDKNQLQNVNVFELYPVPHATIEFYEEILTTLKKEFELPIEGIGIPAIFRLTESLGLTVDKTIPKLAAAGLDSVPAWGGEMLLEIKNRNKRSSNYVPDWLRVVKWVHRFGIKTSCCMRLSKRDSWEERLIHLHKLRSHQDQNVGFSHFCLLPEYDDNSDTLPFDYIESYFRAIAITRLFLDNVPSITGTGTLFSDSIKAVTLSCGANLIETEMSFE